VLNAGLNFAIIFSLFVVSSSFPGIFQAGSFLASFRCWRYRSCSPSAGDDRAVLNVFFRDVGQFLGIFCSSGSGLPPLFTRPPYSLKRFARSCSPLNPMASVITAYQTLLVSGTCRNGETLIPVSLLGSHCASSACGCSASARVKWWMSSDECDTGRPAREAYKLYHTRWSRSQSGWCRLARAP